jgi:hypothetical protein
MELQAAQILPILEELQSSVLMIEERIVSFVPRKHITDTVKNRHINVIWSLGGHCPCCGIAEIVIEDVVISEAEFDHFYSRERRYFEDTWLICRECHLSMKNRIEYLPEFQVYQRRAKNIDNGQLTLDL